MKKKEKNLLNLYNNYNLRSYLWHTRRYGPVRGLPSSSSGGRQLLFFCHAGKQNPAYRRRSISRPMRIVGRKAKFANKQKKFAQRFFTFYKQKFSNLRPLLSITFPQGLLKSKKFRHWTLGSGGKKTVKRSDQKRNPEKKLPNTTWHFPSTIWYIPENTWHIPDTIWYLPDTFVTPYDPSCHHLSPSWGIPDTIWQLTKNMKVNLAIMCLIRKNLKLW